MRFPCRRHHRRSAWPAPTACPVFWLGPPTGDRDQGSCTSPSARPTGPRVDAVHEAAVAAGVEVLHAPARVAGVPPRLLRRLPARSWTATTSRPSTTADRGSRTLAGSADARGGPPGVHPQRVCPARDPERRLPAWTQPSVRRGRAAATGLPGGAVPSGRSAAWRAVRSGLPDRSCGGRGLVSSSLRKRSTWDRISPRSAQPSGRSAGSVRRASASRSCWRWASSRWSSSCAAIGSGGASAAGTGSGSASMSWP